MLYLIGFLLCCKKQNKTKQKKNKLVPIFFILSNPIKVRDPSLTTWESVSKLFTPGSFPAFSQSVSTQPKFLSSTSLISDSASMAATTLNIGPKTFTWPQATDVSILSMTNDLDKIR
jgi:hypothetical protein